jgi:cyclophilin family peptidyl-prolyl cis-trans isomerase
MKAAVVSALVLAVLASVSVVHAQRAVKGPIIVVDTTKGTFEFETYPEEAPKTVAHVLALVKQGFYNGQRFHRVLPGFVVQWGDPRSRDLSRQAEWGRGDEASSGQPIGSAEISKKRTAVQGAVAMAHQGNPAKADSQMFVMLADRMDLNGRYAVFGHLVSGADVLERLQRGDQITRMFIKP